MIYMKKCKICKFSIFFMIERNAKLESIISK